MVGLVGTFSSKITTRCLIGVAVRGAKYQLLAGLVAGAVTEPAAAGAALALPTVAPTASPAPVTVAAAMAA
ncbi:MAG TPA: hypothetical protein VIY52_34035 [Streptosporangiaceae bacterium]